MNCVKNNLKGHYKELILGPLFKLFEAMLELAVPFLMARIIDIGIKNGDAAYVVRHAILLVVLGLAGVLFGCTCQYYASVAAFHFGASLRSQVFSHMLTFSGQEMDEVGTGRLITHLTNDVNQVQNGVNMFIRLATRSPFLAIGSIVMAFVINWRIALIFVLCTPLILAVLYFIMKRTLGQYGRIQKGQDTLNSLAGETLSGARVIRAFSRQGDEQQGFDNAGNALSELIIRVGKISGALDPITYVIANLAIVAIVWQGSRYANLGILQSGDIIALVNYMTQTLLALTVLANLIVQFTRALASAKRLDVVLATEPVVKNGTIATVADSCEDFLAFEGITFGYTPGTETVSQIDFRVQQGQTIGIIGGTGCGKTTLARLLLRFYDPEQGRILLAGQPIARYDLTTLHKTIGYVPQNVNLLRGSIRSNLSLGCPNATDAQLWAALETAQAADFVRQKPGGLDSAVEEGGKNFSGGQRQRLTIARALAATPQLLILDDCSSALDLATDAALRRALKTDCQGMTVLMISQRASSVKSSDTILVMDDGRLVGNADHDKLLASCPVYREICISQKLVGKNGDPLPEGV